MKKYKLVFCLILTALGVSCFIGPFLKQNSVIYSLVDLCKINGNSWVFTLFLIGFSIFVLLSLAMFYIPKKGLNIVCFLLYLSIGILMIFTKQILNNIFPKNTFEISIIPYLICIVSFVISLFISTYIFDENSFTVKDIIEIAIFISFALVLDFAIFKIKVGSNGGSISFAMVPLFIICLRKGFLKGFIACGVVYGLINCFADGYGLVTYPFDYLLGFGSIAIVGLFNKLIFSEKIKFKSYLFLSIGVFVSLVGRTMAATLSGIVIYKLNFVSSLVYQLAYIGPSAAIVFAILILIFPYLNKLHNKNIAQYKY